MSGNKPFRCDQCPLGFSNAPNLSRHRSQKHPESVRRQVNSNLTFTIEPTEELNKVMNDFRNGKISQEELMAYMQTPKDKKVRPTMDIGYLLKGESRVAILEYVKDHLVEMSNFDIVKSYLRENDYRAAFRVAFSSQIYYNDDYIHYLTETDKGPQLMKVLVSQEFLVGMSDSAGLLMILINSVEYDLLMEMKTKINAGADIESIIGPGGITKQIDDLKIPLYGNANKHRIYEMLLGILDDFNIPLNV